MTRYVQSMHSSRINTHLHQNLPGPCDDCSFDYIMKLDLVHEESVVEIYSQDLVGARTECLQ